MVEVLDPSIEAMLADVAGDAQNVMNSAGGDWLPPPQTGSERKTPTLFNIAGGTVDSKRIRKYTNKKDNREYPVMTLPFTVLDGEYEGKEGGLPLFFGNSVSAGLAKEIATLLGYEGTDVPGIIRHLAANWGTQKYRMARYFSHNKQNPDKPYDNTDIQEVI